MYSAVAPSLFLTQVDSDEGTQTMRQTNILLPASVGALLCLYLFPAQILQGSDKESEIYEYVAKASLALKNSNNDVAGESTLCQCSANGGLCDCTANNQCGDKCATSVYPRKYRWVETSKPGHVALYHGDKQLGNWRHEERAYYKLVELGGDNYYWQKGQCPVQSPAEATNKARVSDSFSTSTTSEFYTPQFNYAPAFRQFSGYSGGYSGGNCSGGT